MPVTINAFQPQFSDTTSLNPYDDAFFAKFRLNPPALDYCSYLGGVGREYISGLQATDSTLYFTGGVTSPDFPVSPGVFDTVTDGDLAGGWDVYVMRLDYYTGDHLCTFLGGSEYDNGAALLVTDSCFILCGHTASHDFPVTADAYDSLFNHQGLPYQGYKDLFVAAMSLDMTEVLYGTFLGGWHEEEVHGAWIAADGSIWMEGTTGSPDLPVTPNAIQPEIDLYGDGFVLHFAIDSLNDTPSAETPPLVPANLALTVYPNPFNPTTTLAFTVARPGRYALAIHDILGRLVLDQSLDIPVAGAQRVVLSFEDRASGVYIASLSGPATRTSTKLLHLK